MKLYKVLWLDDEHQKFQSIKDEALLQAVRFVGFTNSKEGGEELLKNHKQYDAVILDGLFFRNKDDVDISKTAFGDVARLLGELKSKGVLKPWFIFSGQPSFVKDKNTLVEIFKDSDFANGKVFDKNRDEDFVELLNEIKKCADENLERQLRLQHQEIFEIFESGLLAEQEEKELLEVFLELEKTENIDNKAVLTKIRGIQEKIFLKLQNIGVLPELSSFIAKCKHLSGNIRKDASGKYISSSIEYQTNEIENLQKWIYFTCGTYIHALQQQHYGGYMISRYSLKSMLYGILELLFWFKGTYDKYK